MEPPAAIEARLRRRLQHHLDQLPVLPTTIAQLLSLSPDSSSHFDDVLRLVESEPNFASRILITANSAASSPIDPIADLRRAVARIGSTGAANLLLAVSVTRVFVPRDPWEKGLWRHGLQVAHAARGLTELIGDPSLNPGEAYTAGLLHDIGRFVLFQEAPDELRQVDETAWETPDDLVATERAICGLTHPELGALACQQWGLPDIITSVVRHHHDPLPPVYTGPEAKLAALVRLADFAMVPSTLPGAVSLAESADDEELAALLGTKVPPFLRLSLGRMREIIQRAADEAEVTSVALGLAH